MPQTSKPWSRRVLAMNYSPLYPHQQTMAELVYQTQAVDSKEEYINTAHLQLP
jgi:hypothetical protein